MNGSSRAVVLGAPLLMVLLCTAQIRQVRYDLAEVQRQKAVSVDWPVYRGDPKGNQFSALAQINATNVHQLRPAWEYHTGDASERSTMYANPVIRLRNRGVSYWKGEEGERIFHFVRDRVCAVDAHSGKLLRSFGREGYIDLRQDLPGRGPEWRRYGAAVLGRWLHYVHRSARRARHRAALRHAERD
jgi:glucose dehydrogenase